MSKPRHIFEIYIRTTPERLWQALTDPELTTRYFYRTAVGSTWRAGDAYGFRNPDGTPAMHGSIVEIEPLRRLVTLVTFDFDPEAAKESPTRMSWEIEALGDVCKLTVVHDDVEDSPKTFELSATGMSPVLSSLKSLLETGEGLEIGRSRPREVVSR